MEAEKKQSLGEKITGQIKAELKWLASFAVLSAVMAPPTLGIKYIHYKFFDPISKEVVEFQEKPYLKETYRSGTSDFTRLVPRLKGGYNRFGNGLVSETLKDVNGDGMPDYREIIGAIPLRGATYHRQRLR